MVTDLVLVDGLSKTSQLEGERMVLEVCHAAAELEGSVKERVCGVEDAQIPGASVRREIMLIFGIAGVYVASSRRGRGRKRRAKPRPLSDRRVPFFPSKKVLSRDYQV